MNHEAITLDQVQNSLDKILGSENRHVPKGMYSGTSSKSRYTLDLFSYDVLPSEFDRIKLYEYNANQEDPDKVGGVKFTLKPEFENHGIPMPKGPLAEQTALSLIQKMLVDVCVGYKKSRDVANAMVKIEDGAIKLLGDKEVIRFVLDTNESSKTIHGYIGLLPAQSI